jgi:hypothetical protein
MNFKPILFSTPMVQAILDGRKTQTRRVVKDISIEENQHGTFSYKAKAASGINISKEDLISDFLGIGSFCKYSVGDVLWVRETFRVMINCETKEFAHFDYLAGEEEFYKYLEDKKVKVKWKPSIFMPKEACRLFLQVKNIRVERLQEISEEDAIAEGAKHGRFYGLGQIGGSTREGFFELWETINKKGSVNKNPWVWVIEFEKIEKPENFI